MKKIILIGSILIIVCLLFNVATSQPINPFILRWLDLTDTPASFSGETLKYVRVNAGETDLEFAAIAGGGDLLSDGSVPMTANWDIGNFDITLKSLTGDGSLDFGGGVSTELVNSAAPTTNATGEIALDTTIVDHQPLWQYYDSGENMTVIAIDTAELPALDNEIVKYDAGTDKFVLEADVGIGDMTKAVYDTDNDSLIDQAAGGTELDTSGVTDGQLLIGTTAGNVWALGTLTGVANETDITNAGGSITIGIVDPLIVGKGGTGATTFTDGGILLGSGAGAITALGAAANGQIPIGDGATDPVLATISEGLAIDITNGAGSITAAFDPTELLGNRTWGDGSTDTIVWTWDRATGTDPTMTFGNGFISHNGDLKILGDDLFMTTNTNRFVLIGDGTNYNPEALDLGTDTTGNYAAGNAEAGAATSGDSATAFFGAGTIEHERGGIEADISAIADGGILVGTGAGSMGIRASALTGGAAGFFTHELGGLEADVSGYSGLLAVSGGATSEVDTFAEIDTQIADKSLVNLEDGGTFTGNVIANANLSVGNVATTAGVLTLLEDTDDGAQFASFMVPPLVANTVYTLPPDDGDNTEVLQTDGAGVLTWVANAGGGATAWDDISDPDNGGLTTITFDNGELNLFTGDNDAAVDFWSIQNTDADHTGGNMYLLNLDYSADDGDVDADFIKLQDSGGIVMTIQQDGEIATDGGITASGTIEGATLTEGGQVVPNVTDNLSVFAATTSAQLYGVLSDETGSAAGAPLAVFNQNPTIAAAVLTGDINAGAADLELPQGQTPDTDGDVDLDFTDGSMVVQHGAAHAELGGSTDVVMGKLIKSFKATLGFPDSLQGEIDNWPLVTIDSTEFPHGIVVTTIRLTTSASSTYAVNVENWDDPTTINVANPTIDAITTSASTEAVETAITYSTIAAGQIIMLDLPTDDISWITIKVEYYEPTA